MLEKRTMEKWNISKKCKKNDQVWDRPEVLSNLTVRRGPIYVWEPQPTRPCSFSIDMALILRDYIPPLPPWRESTWQQFLFFIRQCSARSNMVSCQSGESVNALSYMGFLSPPSITPGAYGSSTCHRGIILAQSPRIFEDDNAIHSLCPSAGCTNPEQK